MVWQNLLIREQVIDTIRHWFKSQGFNEMFTPILVPVPSAESNLEVFSTELRTAGGLARTGYLIMSPEYSLKKIIANGASKIFEITRCFRNEEEVSELHNPEFTMLEWYRTGADYRKIMEDFEDLFLEIIQTTRKNAGVNNFEYQGERYDLTRPWTRLTVRGGFEKFAGIDTETLLSEEKLKIKAAEKGYSINQSTNWEQIFYQIFFNEIEPELKKMHRPVIVYDYPASQAALARKCPSDARFAERWEVFLAGMELGNCFSELTDAFEQRQRFEEDIKLRKMRHKTEYGMDEELLRALKSMPETAGIAVGVDRLVMLAANADRLGETLAFPAEKIFKL